MEDYFEQMVTVFKKYFKEYYRNVFTNQSVETCTGIYNLCKKENPDQVVEMGTNHGASTLSIVKALTDLGKDLSIITSIDLDHEKWKATFNIQKELIKKYDLNLGKVKLITQDFNSVDPVEIIDPEKKVFIFYDMHDHRGPWSQRLLDLWVPLVKNGVFSIHDVTPVSESFEIVQDKISPRTKIQYKSGQYFAGFNECFRIIKWANTNNINIEIFPGGVYFRNG